MYTYNGLPVPLATRLGAPGVRVIDINRSPKIEIPRLHKRQHSAPGSLSQLSPREAERLRDGYDSTPDPAYKFLSALLCSKADCDMAAVPSAVQSAGRL